MCKTLIHCKRYTLMARRLSAAADVLFILLDVWRVPAGFCWYVKAAPFEGGGYWEYGERWVNAGRRRGVSWRTAAGFAADAVGGRRLGVGTCGLWHRHRRLCAPVTATFMAPFTLESSEVVLLALWLTAGGGSLPLRCRDSSSVWPACWAAVNGTHSRGSAKGGCGGSSTTV